MKAAVNLNMPKQFKTVLSEIA